MFRWRFGRKKETAETFVEATGGGWGDLPETVAVDGGSQADFVERTLQSVRAYAIGHEIPIGQEFEYVIRDIPTGIVSPHEIIFGLMMQAHKYGLSPGAMMNEVASFTRLN